MTKKSPKPHTPYSSIEKIETSGGFGESLDEIDLKPVNDFDFVIAKDGEWFYRGSLIQRKALVKLFSTILRRDDDGGYWLQTPVERARVKVEDAPFIAVEIFVKPGSLEPSVEGTPPQAIGYRTNLDDAGELKSPSDLRVAKGPAAGEGRPYVMVRDGLEALVSRAAFYQLADLAVEAPVQGSRGAEQKRCYGVWSNGVFFPLEAKA